MTGFAQNDKCRNGQCCHFILYVFISSFPFFISHLHFSFLISHLAFSSYHIMQGYICSERGRTVRVRIRDNQGFITIKGPSDIGGLARYEFEQEIPFADAEQLMRLCQPGIIDKTRWLVKSGDFTVEVDEFHGDNDGLVMAEVELKSVDDQPVLPPFIGKEVTGDRRYYNSQLRSNPFTRW